MDNFCINCGAKLRKEDNFCANCGTKIDKSYMQQNNHLKSTPDSIEKKKAKKELNRVVGGRLLYNESFKNALLENGLDVSHDGRAIRQQVEKRIDSGQIKSGGVEFSVNQLLHEHKIKKEKEQEKLKAIDEIFQSEEIKSEVVENNTDPITCNFIKDRLKVKIINKRENMSNEEMKHFIKTELKKASEEKEKAKIAKEKEMNSEKIEKNENTYGGHCSLYCRHCYEEFIDGGGGITGDFDDEGYIDYYCHLGHSLSFGRFCEDYE